MSDSPKGLWNLPCLLAKDAYSSRGNTVEAPPAP